MIKMVEIACPRCSSSEAEKVGPDVFVCGHCQTRFIVDHGKARLPEGKASAPAKGGRGPAIAIAGGGLALLAAVVVVRGTTTSDAVKVHADKQAKAKSQPDATSLEPLMTASPSAAKSTAPPVRPSVVEAPAPPTAALESTALGKTSIGGHFWLTTYQNTGEVPIGRPAVVVSLFDSSGARVGEERGYAGRDYLRPGESTTVLISARKPPEYERAEVTPVDPKIARYTREPVDLQVREHVVNPLGRGRSEVVGTVDNQTDAAVEFVKLLVVGRNDSGDPVAFGDAYASNKDLQPGESSGFKVRLGTWVLEDPKTVEVVAFGRPGR